MMLVWLAYLAFLELLSFHTSEFPICVFDVSGSEQESGQNDYEQCPTFHVGMGRNLFYFGSLIRDDPEVVTATVAVAIFRGSFPVHLRGYAVKM